MAKRILLVDDEPLIVKGLRYTLEQEGYEILTAADGEEALQVFFEQPVDLVLLDVMLPKLDGIQVCQRIRESSNVPILMLTAKGEDMDKILGLEYGADDYITKPFNILEVKARIKSIFRRAGAQQQESVFGDNAEVGEVIRAGRDAMRRIRAAKDIIADEALSAQIDDIEATCRQILVRLEEQPGILMIEPDFAEVAAVRQQIPALAHRRSDLYHVEHTL